MQIRDFLSHEWQTIGAVQVALADAGIAIPEVALRRTLSSMQGVLVNGNEVRLTAAED